MLFYLFLEKNITKKKKQPKLGSIEHAEWQSKMNDIAGMAEILIGKQKTWSYWKYSSRI